MISTPFIVCVIGALVWLIFSKWKKVADPWAARFGELLFFVGLFWTVAPYAGKVAF